MATASPCKHKEDDEDLDFICEIDDEINSLCPVYQAREREMNRYSYLRHFPHYTHYERQEMEADRELMRSEFHTL